MPRLFALIAVIACFAGEVTAQQPYYGGDISYGGGAVMDGGAFIGGASVGSNEQMYYYDDQERWKHGYIKVMPYYHGFHSFRPYNYHHVFGQSTTAQGFGMSAVMPYSQQFWHKYEHMADLSQGNHEPVFPGTEPTEENSHYPKPIKEAEIPGVPSAYLRLIPQQRPQPVQQGFVPQGAYSQIFQPAPVQQAIAPVQYQNQVQNRAPQMQGPALPGFNQPY